MRERDWSYYCTCFSLVRRERRKAVKKICVESDNATNTLSKRTAEEDSVEKKQQQNNIGIIADCWRRRTTRNIANKLLTIISKGKQKQKGA